MGNDDDGDDGDDDDGDDGDDDDGGAAMLMMKLVIMIISGFLALSRVREGGTKLVIGDDDTKSGKAKE